MKLVVGKVGRAHGIRGDVAVDIRTDDPDLRFTVGACLETDPPSVGPLRIKAVRQHSGRLVVRFESIVGRAAAEGLRGVLLLVDSADVAASGDPDVFHDSELLQLRAVSTDGRELGRVTDILHQAQDLLVITTDGGGETLVPFVRELVPHVDLSSGRLVVDPPPGLLEL